VSRRAAAPAPVAILAVDGGNLKTDVALVAGDGSVLAALRGGSISHQAVGLRAGAATLVGLVVVAARRAGVDPNARPLARVGAFAVAGADFRRHESMLAREYDRLGVADRLLIRNDAFAPLRAGTDGVGVAVICGSGMNCAGIAPDGRTARFPALGDISGDWGGGGALGGDALWHAVRSRDGRGPRTVLEELVPRHFGLSRPLSVTVALEERRIPFGRLRELAPVVFSAAAAGDAVARSLVDRQADEIVAMAASIVRRLRMTRGAFPVVLGGGVTRNDDEPFWARVRDGVATVAPRATVARLEAPPVLGAALLGLDALPFSAADRAAAEGRLRAELTHERIERADRAEVEAATPPELDRAVASEARRRRGRRR